MPIHLHPGDAPDAFGHHFLVGLQPSPRLTEHDRRLLGELRPAGVILFRDNFDHDAPYAEWIATLGELLRGVREVIGREEILVGLDHEGGRVHRPPPPVTRWPAARHWGDRAGTLARAMAVELRSLGVNLDFAPVADVASVGESRILGDRAFGTTAAEVCPAVAGVVRGLQEEGVWACAKHYPGHGGTTVDSHLELPRLEATLEELRRRDLRPFVTAVAAGVRCVMSAHLDFPRIDPDRPSTLSPTLLHRVLRREMGYRGLVTTDDLGMHAVSRRFDDAGAVVATLEAGTDLLMVCAHWTDTGRALGMARHLAAARRRGDLAEATLAASFQRIRSALAAVPRHEPAELPPAVLERHHALALRGAGDGDAGAVPGDDPTRGPAAG